MTYDEMPAAGPYLRTHGGAMYFRCPGCCRPHLVNVAGDRGPRWTYNARPERPSFAESVRVAYDGADAGQPSAPPAVCHSFVTDGRIHFLADSTHALAGQTVDLPLWKSP